MPETADPKPKKDRTPDEQAEQKLVRTIARALWRVDPATKALAAKDKKASWTEGRRKLTGEARKLSKAMAKEGLLVSLAPTDEPPAK